ncbi:MAG: ChbG/HpnK family deacetylase [Acidobacteriaceae bacterium]|nr:ChbG/HpnK family deacetylase [Acidobacteriaceae bacterium]
MACRLIVNADDFGLTRGVNRAIEQLHRAGVLTSATLMASAAAFDDAVAVARDNPALGVGCHVVLTDGVPVSPPESIPTLLGPDRKSFRHSLPDFVQALVRRSIREEEIELEALAQIEKLQRAGITVTHADTHKHTHLFPAVSRAVLRAMHRSSVGAIRNPFEPAFLRSLGHGGLKRRFEVSLLSYLKPSFLRQSQIRDSAIRTTGGTLGISATGSLNTQTLAQILAKLPGAGVFELICHPGYNDADLDRITTRLRAHREIEMQALTNALLQRLQQPAAPELISYGWLGASRPA